MRDGQIDVLSALRSGLHESVAIHHAVDDPRDGERENGHCRDAERDDQGVFWEQKKAQSDQTISNEHQYEIIPPALVRPRTEFEWFFELSGDSVVLVEELMNRRGSWRRRAGRNIYWIERFWFERVFGRSALVAFAHSMGE